MGQWLSSNKKTITSTVIVVSILMLASFLVYGCINGSIQNFIQNFLDIISPITIGFIIAYLSNKLITRLEKSALKWIKNFSIRRLIAIIITFSFVVFVIIFAITMLIPNLLTTVQSFWDTYIVNYESAATMLAIRINLIMDQFAFFDSTQRIDPEEFVVLIRTNLPWITNLANGDFSAIFPNATFPSGSGEAGTSFDISKLLTSDSFTSILGYALNWGSSMFNFVKNFVLGIFVAIYMLVYKERCAAHFRRFLISCLSPSQARYTFRFASLLDRSFGGFIEGQLLDALIVGIITYILFNIFNFTNPLLLATIIAVTNVIPVLGPFIGGIPAAFLVLLTQPEKVFLFVILILVVQQIDGNLICPHILGDKINISSLATLIAIIVMGGLFGIFGMLIGVPVFAVVLQLINNYTANALRRKGMETSIENYYVGNSNIIIEKNKTQGTKKLLFTIKSITNKLLTKKKNSNKKEK